MAAYPRLAAFTWAHWQNPELRSQLIPRLSIAARHSVRPPGSLRSTTQRIVRPLTHQSADAGTVCNARKRFSSIDSAAEHVGEQIDGSGS